VLKSMLNCKWSARAQINDESRVNQFFPNPPHMAPGSMYTARRSWLEQLSQQRPNGLSSWPMTIGVF